jgi:hypothetical protein
MAIATHPPKCFNAFMGITKHWLQKIVKPGRDLNNTYTNLWMAVPWEQVLPSLAVATSD